MSEIKKINVGPAISAPLAAARRGSNMAAELYEKHAVAEKFSTLKENPKVALVSSKSNHLFLIVAVVMLFHGVQFSNLFLCAQVMIAFCYTRVKTSIVELYSHLQAAWSKNSEDSKADAKAEAKPGDKSKQAELDVAAAKKALKSMDSQKVSTAVFEIAVAAMACHMAMERGLFQVIVITATLVANSRDRIDSLIDLTGLEGLETWLSAFVTFCLYASFGSMAFVMRNVALALSVSMYAAQLITEKGPQAVPALTGILGEPSSIKGLAVFAGLTACGTIWQFWALVAGSGVPWYLSMVYFPVQIADYMVGILH